MRNVWLILRREYKALVFTRAFWFTTLLLPLLIAVLVLLPGKLARHRFEVHRQIVLVVSNAEFGREIQRELASEKQASVRFDATIQVSPSEKELEALRTLVSANALDGYLLVTDDVLAEHRVIYGSRGTADLIELGLLRGSVGTALLKHNLKTIGTAPSDLDELLRPYKMETVRVEAGRESKWSGRGLFIMTVLLVTSLYGIVLMYGVILMRSVLEEKASRVVEILLSAATARQLMAGKILGVGAVGLTQMAIWAFLAFSVMFPTLPLGQDAGVEVPLRSLLYFPVFFVLGYLLYAGLWATLAAVMNSEQEAYQLQTLVMLPLLVAVIMVFFLIRRPDTPMALWLSLVPFFSPLLMYVRILVQTPPAWQIALSLVLLAGTAWFLLVFCARAYQVGILMYGKRPTLGEIWKWIRYA